MKVFGVNGDLKQWYVETRLILSFPSNCIVARKTEFKKKNSVENWETLSGDRQSESISDYILSSVFWSTDVRIV